MSRKLDLQGQLQRYEPQDTQERSYRERMLGLVESSLACPRARFDAGGSAREQNFDAAEDPFSRAHFVPGHFTASAFVLSPDAASLLLIFHGKLHRWLQPGGHVDASDPDILSAARREIHEEVGLSDLALEGPGIFDIDIHEIPPIKADPAHAHFDVRFLFRAPDLRFEAGSDAKAARWVPLGEISEQISDRSVMRAVEKLRGFALG